MFKNKFYVKNAVVVFFDVLHVEITQKLQILIILTIFSKFSDDFQFSLIFGGITEEKFEKGSKKLELKAPVRKT